jgi:hypothetical protein
MWPINWASVNGRAPILSAAVEWRFVTQWQLDKALGVCSTDY